MQSCLFIGGKQDGINMPVAHDADAVQAPYGVGLEKETYIRETLTVDDVCITVYRHESLTPEQVLFGLVQYYKAWAVNRPGGH